MPKLFGDHTFPKSSLGTSMAAGAWLAAIAPAAMSNMRLFYAAVRREARLRSLMRVPPISPYWAESSP